jgi:NADH:ubiquinone oxidoreductase subunit E
MKSLVLVSNLFCWLTFDAQAFLFLHAQHTTPLFQSNEVDQEALAITSQVAEKFKIITCMSTSCNKKRKDLNMDKLTTYAAFYQRIQDSSTPMVQLDEGPCLGFCKSAPCVAIEHEDFVGTVALEGMTDSEFPDRM